MRLRSFLSLVEIRTKLASVIPFAMGTLYALYRYNSFNGLNFIVMLISLITFDMVTTALNNYFDFKRASKKHGYNYERHNAIVRDKLKESTVIAVIIVLLAVAVIFGILLVLNTNIVILLIGMACFAVGILYSFGPIPISRTPLGEIFSGVFMGFIIIFLSVYIHVYDQNIVVLQYVYPDIALKVNLFEIVYVFLVSVPAISGIANIMLANNICDIEDDMENKRYTLPVYIGKKNALRVFEFMYYAAYIDIILLVLMKIAPVISLLSLTTLIPVSKNIKSFKQLQTKKDTFGLSVKNFVLIMVSQIILLGVWMYINL